MRFLRETIASIRCQVGALLEIIVIDNHSNDGTIELALELADRILEEGRERCEQLNAGARVATGAYLYRVDADFLLETDVVAAAVQACELGGFDAVAVHNDSSPNVSYWSAVRNFERKMYRNDNLIVGARFFRKSAFDAIGGFDETLVAGEDYDIHNRLLKRGYRITTIEPGETHLGEPRTLLEVAAKSYFYGKTLRAFLTRNGARGALQMSPLRVAYFRNWRKFLGSPRLAGGFLLMLLVRYIFGAAGLAVAEVSRAQRWRPIDR